MKRILITDCSDSQFWYAGLVGSTVEFVREYDSEYLSREPAGYANIILKTDSKIIDDDCTRVQYITSDFVLKCNNNM